MFNRSVLMAYCSLLLIFLAACSRESPSPPNIDVDIPARTAHPKTIVIFVHGILGNAATTFKAEQAESGWPQLLAADQTVEFPLKVISVAYTSDPIRRGSNIHEIATRLGFHLSALGVFERYEKIIFVTHSMGGLVARRMMLQLSRNAPDSFAKIAGVFFLATPAAGSDEAALAKWVSSNPQFANMTSSDVNLFLQTEDDDWRDQLRRRKPDSPYPYTYCAYETQAIASTVIVPRDRAQAGCDETSAPFDKNHLTMVKPKDVRDEVYEYVLYRIKKIVNEENMPLKISIGLRGASNELLASPAILRSGEQYSLRIDASKPAWFYVVCRDSQGKIERYFPSRAAGSQQAAQKTLRIPSDPRAAFTLDQHTGVERIYVFASAKDDTKLKQLDAEVLSANTPGATLQKAFETRGSKVAPVPPSPGSKTLDISDLAGEPATMIEIIHQ